MSKSARGRTPLSARFLITYAVAYVVLIVLMGLFADRAASGALLDNLTASLEQGARLATESLPEHEAELSGWAEAVSEAGGFRVTLIEADGEVIADSHSDPAVMENHADRPEIVSATRGEVGVATRVSASTGFEQLYVAIPSDGSRVVRTSLPTRVIDEELSAVRYSLLGVAGVAGLLGVVVVGFIARRLARPITELTEQSLAVVEGNLDVEPRRSQVRELDQLGLAISSMASDLGKRVTDTERAMEYLQVVLRALPQGTILIDGEDNIAYANPAAHELIGPVPGELSGLSPYQCQMVIREARETGARVERVMDRDKPARRLRAAATPFDDDDLILLVVVDITDQERVDQIRRDFVANASHELKTPVTTIIASTDALRIAVERDDESAIRFAAQIESSARQLDGLVADLLDLSRLEKEKPDLQPVRLDLLALDEVERIRDEAEAKGLSLDLSADEVVVSGSHRDLSIAVRNLLDNATRYTSEGGWIEVAVFADETSGVVEVRDNGDGIPTRDLDRVFERFYRVDVGRSRTTGGTGLGLSIVRHVCVSHGGSVELESELGVGSTFALRLPLQTA